MPPITTIRTVFKVDEMGAEITLTTVLQLPKSKGVRKCHTHTLQTNPIHREEQNTKH